MELHELTEEDRNFRAAFEGCAVTPSQFNHEAHVRLAYVYLAQFDVESAVVRMRQALRRFLEHNSIPGSKFHETLTRAWVLAVQHFMNGSTSTSAGDFIAKNPELLDSKIMLTHYSASVLFSSDARASFVEPDLDPIPRPGKPVNQEGRLQVTKSSDKGIELTRMFTAPRDAVFTAMTQPVHLFRWLKATGMVLADCEVDLRVGGTFRYVFQRSSGFKIEVRGVYHAVDPPRGYVYTESYDFSPLEIHVTTDLESVPQGTAFRQTLQYSSAAQRDEDFEGVATSAVEAYANLEHYLARSG